MGLIFGSLFGIVVLIPLFIILCIWNLVKGRVGRGIVWLALLILFGVMSYFLNAEDPKWDLLSSMGLAPFILILNPLVIFKDASNWPTWVQFTGHFGVLTLIAFAFYFTQKPKTVG